METIIIERELVGNRRGEIQTLTINAIPVKLSKSFLNKVIKWSSSRHELWKKHEVIDCILKGIQSGDVKGKTSSYFHSGTYCECSNMSRKGTYYVDYPKRVLLDIDDNDSGFITNVYAAYKCC